jgi:TRAP-type mannitol/chloroaromatic compound transport system permease small subunit
MTGLKKILIYCEKLIEWTGSIVCWLLMALMGLAVFEVITRRFLGSPTIWTFELSGFLLAAITVLSLAYTQLHYGHVNIDFLYDRLSRRGKAIIDIITFFPFYLLYCLIFIYFGGRYAAESWAIREAAPTAWNPVIYPIKALIPLGAALLLLIGIVQLIRNIVIAIKGEEL